MKIEAARKHRRNQENKILEAAEISRDETLTDLYSRRAVIGYRIESNGFDFSDLAARRKIYSRCETSNSAWQNPRLPRPKQNLTRTTIERATN